MYIIDRFIVKSQLAWSIIDTISDEVALEVTSLDYAKFLASKLNSEEFTIESIKEREFPDMEYFGQLKDCQNDLSMGILEFDELEIGLLKTFSTLALRNPLVPPSSSPEGRAMYVLNGKLQRSVASLNDYNDNELTILSNWMKTISLRGKMSSAALSALVSKE